MHNKIIISISIILCYVASQGQPTKNSYSIGISGNYTIDNRTDNRYSNYTGKIKQGNFVVNANYYFSKCLFAGINYGSGSNIQDYVHFGNLDNQYSFGESTWNYITQTAGVSLGYYKLISPRILLTLALNYTYGTSTGGNNSIEKDSSIATTQYYRQQNNNSNDVAYNYSINLLPTAQFMLNNHFALSLSLGNLGYKYTNGKSDKTSTSNYTNTNNGNTLTTNNTYTYSNKATVSSFNGSLALSNFLVGVNYYFKMQKKKAIEKQ